MAIKTFNPTTPSRRNMTVIDYSGLSKVKPEKSLLETLKKNSGRNSYGRITVRHRGGGNKKKYRIIDFKRDKMDMAATVLTLEYDPNRSANIALVEYEDKERRYIIAPISSRATACPSPISPWVPSSTTSSCIPAAAPSWCAPLAALLS